MSTDWDWRSDVQLRTPRQVRVASWTNMVKRVIDGGIVILVPWLQPNDRRREPVAVIVPAHWATARAVETSTRVERLKGTEVRRKMSGLTEAVVGDYMDGTPSVRVASRYAVLNGRTRAAKEGGLKQSASSEGSDTIALVSAEWFADQVGTTLEEIKSVGFGAWEAELQAGE